MRIYWPIGLTREMPGRTDRGDLLESTLREYAAHLFDADTTVEIAWMEKTTGHLNSLYLGLVNNAYLIRDIVRAERDGFDAATVGGHWDPGLWAAREAVGIPVTGPGEAAMMVAQMLGRKFAFLTVMEGYVPIIERNIQAYGFDQQAISRRPVRRFGMTFESLVRALEGEPDEFLTALEKTSRECIEDGADVIIAGGQLFGPVLLANSFFSIPGTGVPVVEVSACALQQAASMAALQQRVGLRKSEHVNAPFRSPPREVLDDIVRRLLV